MSQPERHPLAHRSDDSQPITGGTAKNIAARASLSLVPRRETAKRSFHSPLVLWHLLSLDAPSVAALWTFAIADTAHLSLSWTEPAAMFVAVWMLYAADRLLDARPSPNGEFPADLEERHRFHHRHRRVFLTTIVLAAGILSWLLRTLDPRALHLYALLAALLAAWLLLIHTRPLPTASSHRLPKELAVGIFFPAAVFIPTVARLPQLRLDLLLPALLFASVCTLNCLFVYAWEHAGDHSCAHWTTRWAMQHLPVLAVSSVAASCVLFLSSLLYRLPIDLRLRHAYIMLTASTLLSALLLLLLHRQRNRIRPVSLRALADLVLLTPLIIFPVASLFTR